MAKQQLSKNTAGKNHPKQRLYDRLNRWFEQYSLRWLLFVLAAALLCGIFSFDVKPSIDGDDTSYVLSAIDIVHTGKLPVGFRTPGYPIFLSLVIGLFGIHLVLLKVTSLLFFLGIIISLFVVFRKRLPPIILSVILLLIALNPLLLRYSHQTFSELLFTLLLVWTIHFLLLADERYSMIHTVLGAVFTMVCFYIRIAGVTIAGAALLHFVYQRRWKQCVIFVVICAALYSPMKLYEWKSGSSAFGQASILMLKNPYNAMEGMETFGGFVHRFIVNAVNQANYQIPNALGIPVPMELSSADGNFIPNASALFNILASIVVFVGFVLLYLIFISVILQNIFATPRMILPIVPFLILGMLEGFRILGNRWAKVKEKEVVSVRAKKLVVIAGIGLIVGNLFGAEQSIEENYPILKANLRGDGFAGFSEDWANYLRASLWIKNNLPIQSTGVICRKPELFLLYAGNYNVYGTYKIDQTNPDSLIAKWKSLHMTHLLFDEFQWTNLLLRYVHPVGLKYPQLFQVVHEEGKKYPCYVLFLNYNALKDTVAVKKGPL
jgi:hypothetical protein